MRARGFWSALAFLAVSAAPAFADPGDQSSFNLNLLGGIGGSPDVEQGDGFRNTGFQVGFSLVREPGTLVGVRAGKLDLDEKERFGNLREATLSYAVAGGEYLFNEGYYVSGVFLGLGAYRLEGQQIGLGRDSEETAIGGTLGLSGEFAMTRALAIRIEVSGHYTDLEPAQLFGAAHAGVSLHF